MPQTGLGSGGEEAGEAAQTARTPSCPHPAASGLCLSSRTPRPFVTGRHLDPATPAKVTGSPGDPLWRGGGDGLSRAFTPRKSWASLLPPL